MNTAATSFFENLPELLAPKDIEKALPSTKKSTVYDWRYRPAKYDVPNDLFVEFGQKIFVRRDVLKRWVNTRNR